MPLIHGKSKKSFEHNVEAEMHAGKPQAQSLAIAYSLKRKAQKHKMAGGGDVHHEEPDHDADMVHRILKKCYSEGGKVANGGDADPDMLADHDSANFDDLALRDDLEFHDTGANSGDELGGPHETDHEEGEDMVKRILRRQHNPRPA